MIAHNTHSHYKTAHYVPGLDVTGGGGLENRNRRWSSNYRNSSVVLQDICKPHLILIILSVNR